jgi:hypothetical protein
VFFSNDPTRTGWKVVCHTNVCGRCGDLDFSRADIELLAVGLDANFEGLQPSTVPPVVLVPTTSTTSARPLLGRHNSTTHAAAESSSDFDEDEGFGDWHS